MKSLSKLWDEIQSIHERNDRVQADKAWETSWARKILIGVLTYFVVVLFFSTTKLGNPWLNAIVPSLGFFLSTLSVPFMKKLWIRYVYKK